MSKPYTVLALFRAKPGKELELKKILMSLVEPTRKEPGCIDYNLHCDPNDPGAFMFYENFTHKEAHEEHKKTPYIRAWHAQMDHLTESPIDVTYWQKL